MAISSTILSNVINPISPELISDSAITVMLFCNLNVPDINDPDLGKQFIDVFLVADGDAPTSANKIVNQIPINAGDTFTFNTERIVLGPGDRVHANTTTAGQTSVTISYVVI
jgi:hypothetical protein